MKRKKKKENLYVYSVMINNDSVPLITNSIKLKINIKSTKRKKKKINKVPIYLYMYIGIRLFIVTFTH